jgi:nucleoside-diphosphate-sugar epimerase
MKILITGGNGNIAKMIYNGLNKEKYQITALGRNSLNLLNQECVIDFLNNNSFDILIHTAIIGGRRTKEETSDVVYNNMIMFENIIKYANKFKMIINFDSGAIYNRNTDINNRKESDINIIPSDYYGFSKYLIYNRSLQFDNLFNFRIFNIFHINEENDRFIKKCFSAKEKNEDVVIFEDKYFDFFYEDDFIRVINYYFENIDRKDKLHKTINLCYETKYKLSDIALLIVKNKNQINIVNPTSNNYTGDGSYLKSLNIELNGLEKSLTIYENNLK